MANLSSRPIGVFDSGIGGLTVVKSIMHKLPHENIVYFGDIARLPYGTKSVATIRKFAEQTVQFLLQHDVKSIVIACNTISAVAKNEVIKMAGDIPVLDVISAGSRASQHGGNKIGIIATPATINSNAYPNSINKLNKNVVISQVACTLFVPLIEEGYIEHPALDLIAREYLEPLLQDKIDTLVLGCTHYPIIKNTLAKIIGKNVTIIDPADTTSDELVTTLKNRKLLNYSLDNPRYEFYVTELSPKFNIIGEMFLNTKLGVPKLVNLD
jgi:glutamate racemase